MLEISVEFFQVNMDLMQINISLSILIIYHEAHWLFRANKTLLLSPSSVELVQITFRAAGWLWVINNLSISFLTVPPHPIPLALLLLQCSVSARSLVCLKWLAISN